MPHRYQVKLKIADVIIQAESQFPIEPVTDEEKRKQIPERFDNFFFSGKTKADILIQVHIVKKLPAVPDTKPIFITHHNLDKTENWRFLKRRGGYAFTCPLDNKQQVIFVSQDLTRVKAYLLPKKSTSSSHDKKAFIVAHNGFVWDPQDLIYDFLQVLLINYFAKYNLGVLAHAVGIKDADGRGFLFTGESGAGKSTTARIWHKHGEAMVLNDDRIIIRKKGKKFFIYGSPWHGDFNDYLISKIDAAPLQRIFFIYHARKNTTRAIAGREAFLSLYPVLFPPFWDKDCLETVVSFCQDMISVVPCSRMGFVNDENVIPFVREL